MKIAQCPLFVFIILFLAACTPINQDAAATPSTPNHSSTPTLDKAPVEHFEEEIHQQNLACLSNLENPDYEQMMEQANIAVFGRYTFRILAWDSQVDDRPLYLDTVLILGEGLADNDWVLIDMFRHPRSERFDSEWQLSVVTDTPWAPVQKFSSLPGNQDIYAFTISPLREPRITPYMGFTLLAAAVCEDIWLDAIGEAPTRFYPPIGQPAPDCDWNGTAFVWLDENENGIREEGELPLSNVNIKVTETLNNYGLVETETTNGIGRADLRVFIHGCSEASYLIEVETPANYEATTPIYFEASVEQSSVEFGFTYATAQIPTLTPQPLAQFCQNFKVLDGWIWDIAVASDNSVWIAANTGVAHYDPEQNSWITYTTDDGLVSPSIQSITIAPDGAVWFSAWTGTVSRFDGTTWQTFTREDGLATDDVNDVAVLEDGTVWFATADGIFHWQPEANLWQHFTTADGLPRDRFNKIAVGLDNSLWFGGYSDLARFVPFTSASGETSWQVTVPEPSIVGPIDYDTIVITQDGKVWFGSIHFYDPETDTWGNSVYQDFSYDAAVTNEGALWVATGYGAIFIPEALISAPDSWHYYGTVEGLAGDDIRSLALENDHTVWFGAEKGGVSRCSFPADGE